MGVDGSVVIDTKILDSGFKKGMSGLKSVAKAGAIAIGAGMGLIAGGLLVVAKRGVQLASDLQEVQNVVDVTFGRKGAAKIEEWAKVAQKQFGLSELQAKRWTGTLGAMVKSQGLTTAEALAMSKGLAGLTGDFASFYNLDHEDAFEKIRSGISGETEPLKQIGINMSEANLEAFALSEGIKKPLKEMSQGEKTQLRYAYLMKVSADAQGDFARTADSYANQLRTFQMKLDTIAASLGKKLLPQLSEVLDGMMSGLDEMAPAIDSTFDGLAGLLTGKVIDTSGVRYGEEVVTAGDKLTSGLTTIIGQLAEGMKTALPIVIQTFSGIIVALAKALPGLMTATMPALIDGFRTIVDAMPEILPPLVQALSDIILMLAAALPDMLPQLVDAFVLIVTLVAEQLGVMAPELIPPLLQAVNLMSAALMKQSPRLLKATLILLKGLLLGLVQGVASTARQAPALWRSVIDTIKPQLPKWVSAAVSLMGGFLRGLREKAGDLVDYMRKIPARLVDAMGNIAGKFLGIGRAIVAGIRQGIENVWDGLVAKLQRLAKNLPAGVKKVLGIESPSKVFAAEVGAPSAEGIGVGFSDSMKAVYRRMRASVNSEMGRFASVVVPRQQAQTQLAAASGGMTVNFHQPVRTYSETVRAARDINRGVWG